MSKVDPAEARKLFENPAFKAACEAVEERMTVMWKSSTATEEIRERCWMQLQALMAVIRALREAIEDPDSYSVHT